MVVHDDKLHLAILCDTFLQKFKHHSNSQVVYHFSSFYLYSRSLVAKKMEDFVSCAGIQIMEAGKLVKSKAESIYSDLLCSCAMSGHRFHKEV